MKKTNLIRCIACCLICAISSTALFGCYFGEAPEAVKATEVCSQTVNEIDWSITYYVSDKAIVSISASYSEHEKTSSYYKKLAYRYGDNTVYVTHLYTLKGTPLEDGWFSIEQTEKAINGWDSTEIFFERRTNYEEKIVFSSIK